jgi:hypothetical protein
MQGNISQEMQELSFESSFLALDNDDEAVQPNQAFFVAPGENCPMLPSSMGQEEMFPGETVCIYLFCISFLFLMTPVTLSRAGSRVAPNSDTECRSPVIDIAHGL